MDWCFLPGVPWSSFGQNLQVDSETDADFLIVCEFSLLILTQMEIEFKWSPFISKWLSQNSKLQGLQEIANFNIAPYFFEEIYQNGKTILLMVNDSCEYCMQNYAIPRIQNEHKGIENIMFMQDGTLPHIYRSVKEFLSKCCFSKSCCYK